MARVLSAIFIIYTILLMPIGSQATVYLQDGFESGDLNSPTGVGSWGLSNCGGGGCGLGVDDITVSTDDPRTGLYSLKMLFQGNESLSDDAWAEQNFNIGANVIDVYIGYDIKLPSNYTFRETGASQNNKLILLDGGVHDDPMTVDVEWEGDSYGGFKLPRSGYPYSPTCATAPVSPGYIWGGSWSLSTYYGGWHRFVWHFKMDSGSGDGAYELFIDDVQFFSRTAVTILNGPPCSPGYYSRGYLMGWANTGFDDDTIVYIDNVTIASTYDEAYGEDTTPPTVTSATINTAGTTLTLAMSESVTNNYTATVPTLSMSGGAVTASCNSCSSGTSLTYTLSRTIDQTETGTYSWDVAANGVEDAAGNDLVDISGAAITNDSEQDTTPPSTPSIRNGGVRSGGFR